MDFGIFMEFEIRAANQAGAFEEGFHFVDVAEAWGLDIAWLGEMHFSPAAPDACGWGWPCRSSR